MTRMRRRLYLMRHGAVSYFDSRGGPAREDEVHLTEEGRAQAEAARALLEPISFDRVLASPLPRAVETAEIVAQSHKVEVETWPALRELKGARLSSIPPDELEDEFVHAFRGVVPNEKRFLGGETIGELFDRVLPALESLFADTSWDSALAVLHGAVNRAILSYALAGERIFLGHFEQAPGCVEPRRRRRRLAGDRDRARGQPRAARPPARLDPADDDGGVLGRARALPPPDPERVEAGRARPLRHDTICRRR